MESGIRADSFLFGESQSRVIISFAAKDLKEAERICSKHGAPFEIIGKVGGRVLKINGLIDAPLEKIFEAWKGSFKRYMG